MMVRGPPEEFADGREDGVRPSGRTSAGRDVIWAGCSAEHPALYLAAVVLQGAVQVHGGGLCGGFGWPVPDGTVDRVVFFHGGVGAAADSAQADDAGLTLQHACFADRGDEEEV